MMNTALFYFTNFIYMEFIFHLYFWRDVRISLFPALAIILSVSLVQSLLTCLIKGKGSKVVFWIFMGFDYLLFASQLVYRSIFKQPLLIDAIIYGGGDALTNYWREALQGILDAGLGIVALSLCIMWTLVVLKIWNPEPVLLTGKRVAVYVGSVAASILVLYGSLFGLMRLAPDSYAEYQEFGYPEDILENFGVTAFWTRDAGALYLPEEEELMLLFKGEDEEIGEASTNHFDENSEGSSEYMSTTETVVNESAAEGTGTTEEQISTETVVQEPENLPNTLPINFDYLKEIGSDDIDKITDYILSMSPTMQNDYTGMFEGYNLIFLTAEGFSTAAVDETLTPTLYKLINSGVVASNYYVPLWQTSTSDGEYVNLMGLIPDQQFSMKRSAANSQPYSLANYFKSEGAVCYAYHNNTLSYYDRHLSHPNLGYIFKASKLGDLDEAQWGGNVFQMEHPDYWPASDLEMVQATLPEYINEERFHVYYLTVSGHMNYNFLGNRMSSFHKEEVSNLPYSEEGRAYIACNMELDRALQYLIEQLDAAGKLEKTVICLSADHYPYAMNLDNYEEMMGMELENTLDIYRNSLILWNSEMETVVVDKPCCSVDLMPTLLNLFGFEYDSRLFSGRDIFSDQEGLVVFSNRSFITDTVSYNKKTGEVSARTDAPVSDEYVNQMKEYVKMLYKHSAGILNYNYYSYFTQAGQE